MKQALFLGAYDEQHARLKIITKALKSQGFEIVKWNIKSGIWVQYFRFLIRSPKIVKDALRSNFILVPYPGWKSVTFAKLMSILSGKKLIFDTFISSYNTFIEDRKYYPPKSLKALYHLMRDSVNCRLADIVLLDTNEHIEYMSELLALPKRKFIRVFVGVDINENSILEVDSTPSQKITLFFVGTFIPLHGLKYIIRALHILRKTGQSFRFVLVGMGQEAEKIDAMIRNLKLESDIERHAFIPYKQLIEYIRNADICLGIFGDTNKAKMVIPTKIYDYAAQDKVIISGNSKAMLELFTENKDFIGCNFADENMLADRLLEVIRNLGKFKAQIKPRSTILKYATPEKIGVQLVRDLKALGISN